MHVREGEKSENFSVNGSLYDHAQHFVPGMLMRVITIPPHL